MPEPIPNGHTEESVRNMNRRANRMAAAYLKVTRRVGAPTPGPWRVAGESGNDGEAEVIEAADGKTVAWTADTADDAGQGHVTAVDKANARLIAAAPFMLNALENIAGGHSVLPGYSKEACDDRDILKRQREAIALEAIAVADGQPPETDPWWNTDAPADTFDEEKGQGQVTAEDKSNAWIIAAAPDLLAALESLTEAASERLPQDPDHDGLINCDLLAKSRAAIAKAKGGE